MMRVVAVIPAFNEAATVAGVAERARRYCPVVVVDDGSTDDTVASLADVDVTVLRNEGNRGKAASLWNGFAHALASGFDAVVTLDADGQHAPEEIPRLVAAAEANPGSIVIAARTVKQDRVPPLRLFANRTANFWISWAAGYHVTDSQSGFRLYPAALLRRLALPVDRSRSFVFESEVLIAAARLGVRSVPVPVEAIYPDNARPSHYHGARDTARIVGMVGGRLLRRGMDPPGLWRSLRERARSRGHS
ncbi:glycosyltransferase family 2 protein [Aquisalimonas lutea]|uniref:glycosyltransferase family 2 protein n=1 Tax=Aquisalimonas lutea TaxID=1327750 RepID=UPI0025B391EF|nr:glycosyltransferase family 2 protein [Aquisalimonas lutea]MDN3517122.1 glycosyltransferase family 2 protein [Aquisalimonas lutea]